MGRFIKLIFIIVVVGVSIYTGIYFGWQNDDPVLIRFYRSEYTLPLFALCYLFMIGGLFVTLFIVAYDYIKMYAQNRSLKRELRYYIRLSQENQVTKNGSFQNPESPNS